MTTSPDREDALVRSLLTGIAVFRWLAWVWMAVLLVVNRSELSQARARPSVALVLVGAALLVTVVDTALLRTDPARLLALPVVAPRWWWRSPSRWATSWRTTACRTRSGCRRPGRWPRC
jgi:hypothetical protein